MKKLSIIISILIFISINLFSQNNNLGVNLDHANSLVNLAKQINSYSNVKSYDSLGWPQSDFNILLDGRPVAEWNNDIDDPEVFRLNKSGRYKCSFNGSANVVVGWSVVSIENKTYDTNTNTTFFDLIIGGYPNPGHGLVNFTFSNTKRSANDPLNSGITNLKINRPGYPIDTKKIFTDEYLSLLKSADFACYRFYGLENVWGSEPNYPNKTVWSKRKTPNDASQMAMTTMNGKRDEWCWEYIIELSNILKKDIWINVCISADSDYVINLATLLKTTLDPNINIYVENSNEVWSPTQETHGPYNKAQADFYKITFDQNYARRTVEVSNLFEKVYGKAEMNKKVRVVLGAQQAYGGRSDIHFDYINNNIGSPKEYIYALAPSLYFGSTKPNVDTSGINQGMIEDINSQIASTTDRKGHLARAKKWGLVGGCVSYEGGPGLPSGGNKTNLTNQILSNRTYKMKEIIKKNYEEGWFDLGGNLAMYFTIFSPYTRYGCWGITDDYTNPERNYKMQAVKEIIGKSVPTISVSTNTLTIAYPSNSKANFNIKSNTNWTLNVNQTWLKASNTIGSGDATITLTAEENKSANIRNANVEIVAIGSNSKTINVIQEANKSSVEDGNSKFLLSASPNPFRSVTTLIYYYSEIENNINIRVFNELGIEVLKYSNLSSCEGINKYQINLNNLPNGVYCAEINDGNSSSFLKMIKVKE
jgi:hypothetical protein